MIAQQLMTGKEVARGQSPGFSFLSDAENNLIALVREQRLEKPEADAIWMRHFDLSADVRAEFGNSETYSAFMNALAAGLFSFRLIPASP